MTTVPIKAGAEHRLPPIAVKLNGETAKTKPSYDMSKLEKLSYEWTIFGSIPNARRVLRWLLSVDFLRIQAVETPKIAELGSSVDFGLPNIFSLTKHGSCHNLVSVESINMDSDSQCTGILWPISLLLSEK